MLRSIDHIVVVVRDLQRASADYQRAGFTVTPGGEHTGGATHNALISFGDGAYFELIAFREPDRPQDHRWWSRLAQGEGLVDYALLSDDLAADAAALRGRGLAGRDPVDGGRLRPDGQRIAWRSLMLGRGVGHPALPFVIEDVTPPPLRVPGGPATHHRLPATRVAGLTLVVASLSEGVATFASLLGAEGGPADPSVEGAGGAVRFGLGRQWLELVQPGDESGALGQYLEARGEGPYEVVLGGDGAAGPGSGELLELGLTHGARIRVGRGA